MYTSGFPSYFKGFTRWPVFSKSPGWEELQPLDFVIGGVIGKFTAVRIESETDSEPNAVAGSGIGRCISVAV